MKSLVVIPTFNERDNIAPLLEKLDRTLDGIGWEAVFVDDDSTDGTVEALRLACSTDARIRCVRRLGRRGLASAVVEGIQSNFAPFIAVMDADLQHDERLLAPMLAILRKDEADVVVGSRYANGITVVNWPIERILISYFGNAYTRRVTGLHVHDTTGGFRCMRRAALERVGLEQIRSNGYAFQIELNYRFQVQGARVKEIEFFFLDRRRGTSKLTLRIAVEALWMAWWLRLAHALGRI